MSDIETPLKRLMARHGLTQVVVASAAGISQPFLSDLATGSSRPSIEVAIRLVRTLREATGEPVTVESIFGSQGADLVEPTEKAS